MQSNINCTKMKKYQEPLILWGSVVLTEMAILEMAILEMAINECDIKVTVTLKYPPYLCFYF